MDRLAVAAMTIARRMFYGVVFGFAGGASLTLVLWAMFEIPAAVTAGALMLILAYAIGTVVDRRMPPKVGDA